MFSRFQKNAHQTVPNLVVAQRVLGKMQAAAEAHVEDETGEAMVGLLVPGNYPNAIPTLYVLDTISPDESAVRQYHTFQQGDERQDELIWWLQENWQATRDKRFTLFNKNKWDVPLRYLGDWHKQPGYMIQPSGGDLMTAMDWILDPDNDMDFLLAPIITLDHPSTIATSSISTNFVMLPQEEGTSMRVDFWYIDRKSQAFLPISPTIYPDDQLPTLAPYPWHVVNETRIDEEIRLLEGDNLFNSITLWNADNEPPLEVCFLVARMGSSRMLIIVTPHDYPQSKPSARVAPFVQMGENDDMQKVFETAWKQSEPVDMRDYFSTEWTPEKHLLDLIHAIERKLGLRTDSVTKPGSVVEDVS
jgi:hypothetical protein